MRNSTGLGLGLALPPCCEMLVSPLLPPGPADKAEGAEQGRQGGLRLPSAPRREEETDLSPSETSPQSSKM